MAAPTWPGRATAPTWPVPSPPWATDPYNTSIVGVNDAGMLTDMHLALVPRGRRHEVARGRGGNIVQPYGTYGVSDPADVGEERRYHVELWPIGNQLDAGHRLRLHVIGASGASQPGPPAVHTVRLGDGASRLLFPVLPGSDLPAALDPAAGPAGPEDAGTLPRTGGPSAAVLGVVLLAAGLAARRVRPTNDGTREQQ